MRITYQQLRRLIRETIEEQDAGAAPAPAAPPPADPNAAAGAMPVVPAPTPAAPPAMPGATPAMPPAAPVPGAPPVDPNAAAPVPPAAPVAAPAAPAAPVDPNAVPPAAPPAPMAEAIRRIVRETVRLHLMEKEEKKWMQKAGKEMEKKGTKGALHRALGKKEGTKLSKSELESKKAALQKKGEGDKKLSDEDRKMLRRIIFALNAMKAKKD